MGCKKDFKRQVIQTLAYADLFDYPMREREIVKWLVGQSEYLDLSKINGVVFRKNGFFFLRQREYLIKIRKRRQKQAIIKLKKAKQIARLLGLIPTIRLIGISGSLSMENTENEDDIDFFIITQTNALWLTRFLSVILLELMGRRRRPNDEQVKDRICLNMFMDETHLKIPQEQQNLYTAHEVCQLKVLFDRNGVYQKFLNENQWVKECLPNAIKSARSTWQMGIRKEQEPLATSYALFALEFLAKSLQLSYMKIRGRLSRATMGAGYLYFYPPDFHTKILKSYKTHLSKYDVSF